MEELKIDAGVNTLAEIEISMPSISQLDSKEQIADVGATFITLILVIALIRSLTALIKASR